MRDKLPPPSVLLPRPRKSPWSGLGSLLLHALLIGAIIIANWREVLSWSPVTEMGDPDQEEGGGGGGGSIREVSLPAFQRPAVTPPPPPVVTVYTEPPRPVIHEYDWSTGGATPAPASSPIYLIALKDGSIHAATSYQVEAGSFQFINVDGEKKQTPVDSIDRPLVQSRDCHHRRIYRFHDRPRVG